MTLNFDYVPGKRAIKTAIAVMLCMVYSILTGRAPTIACVTAIICLRPTSSESKRTMLNRLIATFIGGLIGYLTLLGGSYLPGYRYWSIVLVPLMVLVDIYLCNILGKKDAIVLSCVVLIVIASAFEKTRQEMLLYAVGRELDTAVGAVLGTGVNYWLWNPSRKPACQPAAPPSAETAAPSTEQKEDLVK